MSFQLNPHPVDGVVRSDFGGGKSPVVDADAVNVGGNAVLVVLRKASSDFLERALGRR